MQGPGNGRSDAWSFTIFLLLLVLLISTGCVERKLFIHSEPSGASVCLNGKQFGETPVAIPFQYYGDFFLEIRRRGYRVEKKILPVPEPWYQIFPMDAFFDLVWPFTLNDDRVVTFLLEPHSPEDLADKEAIMERAGRLR